MNGGSGYNMSTQMVFTSSDGTVLATSMSGGNMTYAYGDSKVLAYSGAEVTGGENISTLGQPAIYISGYCFRRYCQDARTGRQYRRQSARRPRRLGLIYS